MMLGVLHGSCSKPALSLTSLGRRPHPHLVGLILCALQPLPSAPPHHFSGLSAFLLLYSFARKEVSPFSTHVCVSIFTARHASTHDSNLPLFFFSFSTYRYAQKPNSPKIQAYLILLCFIIFTDTVLFTN